MALLEPLTFIRPIRAIQIEQVESRMTARRKLSEARFFLVKMQASQLGSEEFRYYASACVSALYSVTNHLLYDYAKKLWPQITANQYLDARLMSLLAKITSNKRANDFIEWYNKLLGRIKSNPDTKAALDVRDMEIHRGNPTLAYELSFLDTLDVSDRIEYGIMNSQGTITPSGTQIPTPKQVQLEGEGSKIVLFFTSYRAKDIADTLSSSCNFIDAIIKEAESLFGSL